MAGQHWNLRNVKVLVTGGAGFIGSAIARSLIDKGHFVTVLDNLATGFVSNIPRGANFVKGDIRDLSTVEEASRNISVVFHQAAFKSVPRSIENPFEAEANNALGTLNVLTAARDVGVERVIYASSSSVYGEGEGIKDEALPTKPISPYGVSKLSGEHYCRVWARVHGLSTVSLRYFNVFGPYQRADSQYAAVIPAFISSLQSERSATIYGDGTQTRDFTFVGDVVRANLLAMEASADISGAVMNICAGSPRTVNELHGEVAKAMGSPIPPKYAAPRTGDIRHSYGDISRAKTMLNWSPEADWSEAIHSTVDWFTSSSSLEPGSPH